MEVGLILAVIAIQAWIWSDISRRVDREAKKVDERLQTALVQMVEVAKLMSDLKNLLDNTNQGVQEVARMEKRLMDREDARQHQKRLLDMKEGGWRGV